MRDVIERGVGYKLTAARELRAFASLSIVLGDDFDTSGEYPQVKEILSNELLPPSEKMQLVIESLE